MAAGRKGRKLRVFAKNDKTTEGKAAMGQEESALLQASIQPSIAPTFDLVVESKPDRFGSSRILPISMN